MKKAVIIWIALIFMMPLSFCQTSIPKAQSLFIYNFSRLIEWPASARSGTFVIGILGSAGEIGTELTTYMKGKKVGTQDIQVRVFKTVAEIQGCHILFVPFSRTKLLSEVIPSLSGKYTLIITEKSGALNEGAAINFMILEDKMKFEIKSDNATRYGIKFSAKLQEMAKTGGA
jgi:hypothetical protein